MAGGQPVRVVGAWAPLTSFVGREREAAEVTGLLREYRLVTVTGPGGVGKTRLAVEVARAAADQFPDGAFFLNLGSVADPSRVAGEIAATLGVGEIAGQAAGDLLARALERQRLLLVLDNCEHVLDAVAGLCGELLKAADDIRILATSREQLGVGGESWYRLAPLELPESEDPAEIARSDAVALFAERARLSDPGFALSPGHAALAARVTARLDGMPLAIEMAAARVEALGMAGLADRVDDALRLLEGRDSLAATRHRSLRAVADWSYRLLSEPERQVFRWLAAFPGPFTLEAAEAAAGPQAGTVVLRLVDCSLLTPPRPGPDGRMRYSMLQTLRDYGLDRLAEAGEEQRAMAAMASFALSVAEQAAAGLATSDHDPELAALRWLDAENATLDAALAWALGSDPATAPRLATALVPWWLQRGRLTEGYQQLAAAAAHAAPGSEAWARAQLWLGYLSSYLGRHAESLAHHTSVYEAAGDQPSEDAVVALTGRALNQMYLGHAAEGIDEARRALALARRSGYRVAQARALTFLGVIAFYSSDDQQAAAWMQQAIESLTADVPGFTARLCRVIAAFVLANADPDSARRACAEGLAWCREADDLIGLSGLLMAGARLESMAGNVAELRTYLHEGIAVASRIGDYVNLGNCIGEGGHLCAATEQWADAMVLWAAHAAHMERTGTSSIYGPGEHSRLAKRRQEVAAMLEPAQVRAAEDRGAGMTLAAAAEFVTMLTAPLEAEPPDGAGELTARERELVTLVAQGRTNAEIAAQLFISVRTVSSHLDRIRDKTGYRRRADLTRLALREGLI